MDTQLIDSTITQNSVKKLNVRCQSHKYKPVKEPPEKYIKSIQLDLFSYNTAAAIQCSLIA